MSLLEQDGSDLDTEEFFNLVSKGFDKVTFDTMANRIIGPEWPEVGLEWIKAEAPELEEQFKKYL